MTAERAQPEDRDRRTIESSPFEERLFEMNLHPSGLLLERFDHAV
jgi:hypothetical protein